MHPSREVAALLVSRLRGLRAAGDLTTAHVRQAAESAEVTERTVWRWMGQGVPGTSGRHAYRLTEADRDALATASGSVTAAWRIQRSAGEAVPLLRTYQRAFARELLPIERAAAADGVQGQRRHTVYLRWEAEHRNQRWEADHVELPVLVLPPRARRPRAPWVTLFLDAYSRLVMGWALSMAPSAATVLAALHIGIVVDPERGPFGGVPAMLRPDRGLEFAAHAISQAAGAIGMLVLPAPARRPHLKGKIERLGRIIAQDFLCTLPFYAHGPRDAAGKLYGPADGPMTLERFAAEFAGWVHHYNTARPHQGLGGQTPLERWQQDATPLRELPASELRFLLLAGHERMIGKSGIRFDGRHYIAPELHGRVGQRVEVRHLPHDPRRIEVFHAGGWLCTAKPQGALTAAERDRVLERRRADAAELARRQRRASRAARARLAPITGAGPVTDTTVVTRGQAVGERARSGDGDLRRLARTNLLGLEELAQQTRAGRSRRRTDGAPLPGP